LLGRHGRVDADDDAAHGEHGAIDEGPLEARLAQDGDSILVLEAERGEPGRDALTTSAELARAEGLPALAAQRHMDERALVEASIGLVEEMGEGVAHVGSFRPGASRSPTEG